jgi:subtilase family serine protease
MSGFRLRRLALVTGTIAVLTAAGASAAQGDVPTRAVLAQTKPTWTAAATASAAVGTQTTVSAKVWLAPRDAAQLDALATAISDPSSAQYRQFLSADQVRAQFAPTADQVTQVTKWLSGAGLTVGAIGADNRFVAVSGTAAAINAAFGTQVTNYVVGGHAERAPATDLSVPLDLAGTVQAVTGIATFGHVVKQADFGPPDAFVPGTPCSSYYGEKIATNLPKFHGKKLPFNVCGYPVGTLRTAYGVDRAGTGGAGSTVAITDAYDAPQLESDTNTYSSLHGDTGFAAGQFTDHSVPEDATTGDDCGGNGWYGEQALDVEAVHGMAQSANVLYYGAASCFDDDFLVQLNQIVADNEASIVTNSWGEPTFVVVDGQVFSTIDPALVNAYETVFKEGALQGIGFYFSSGDDGDDLETWGVKHPDYPTGDPWVTSVGGTSIAIGKDNTRLWETGWGTSLYALADNGKSWVSPGAFHGGAGGGFSQVFGRPWYQEGVVPRNTKGRAVPDIAMDADPTTGMLVGETQNFPLASVFGPAGNHYGEYRIGGTSLASPLMAGVQAVAQGAGRLGFANPKIYHLARVQANTAAKSKGDNSAFYDVIHQGDVANARADNANGVNADDGTVFSVRTFDQDSSLKTTRGWDDVTGVGAPTSKYLDEIAWGW